MYIYIYIYICIGRRLLLLRLLRHAALRPDGRAGGSRRRRGPAFSMRVTNLPKRYLGAMAYNNRGNRAI